MRGKQDTESIRFSQVLSGALAATTAAVLGSTMGVAGTVIGAGLASVVTTVGGALYLRSIHRTNESVRSVRERVVTRIGSTTVTVTEDEPSEPDEKPAEESVEEPAEESAEEERPEEQPPPGRRIRWPAVVAASVLAFALGMAVITGVEWLRGEPLSGGEGTTLGDIVQTNPGDGEDDEAPPATTESTTTPPPSTDGSTATTTPTPDTNGSDQAPSEQPSESDGPETTAPTTTTTESAPIGSASAPPSG